MPGKKWSPKERMLLTSHYEKRGIQHVQYLLAQHGFHRTPSAIRCKAAETGLELGRPRGYMTTREVVGGGGNDEKLFRKQAEKDGVLERFTDASSRAPWMVPDEYGFKYMERIANQYEAETLGWLNTKQAARVLGVGPELLSHCIRKPVKNNARREAIRNISRARGIRQRWLWDPSEVRSVAERFKNWHERRKVFQDWGKKRGRKAA